MGVELIGVNKLGLINWSQLIVVNFFGLIMLLK